MRKVYLGCVSQSSDENLSVIYPASLIETIDSKNENMCYARYDKPPKNYPLHV